MAVDYLRLLPPTGNGRGAAAYHDKRFALAAVLRRHDTAIFLDADSRFETMPCEPICAPGLAVAPVGRNTVAGHLEVCGTWRRESFVAVAEYLTAISRCLVRPAGVTRAVSPSRRTVAKDDSPLSCRRERFSPVKEASSVWPRRVPDGLWTTTRWTRCCLRFGTKAADRRSDDRRRERSFVLCIEDDAICEQAILLCHSIRRFTGGYRRAPIFAVRRDQGRHSWRDASRARRPRCVLRRGPLNLSCPMGPRSGRGGGMGRAACRVHVDCGP